LIIVVQVLLQEVLNGLELTTLAIITACIVILNDKDNGKQRITCNAEGSGYILIRGIILAFFWGDWGRT
jgi:hypothetical protein